jgi:hypothetical protein
MRISPSAANLLADLRTLGIELQPHGDRIRFRPRHVITKGLLERLRIHKAELLIVLGHLLIPFNGETWNQGEADALLTELRAEVARIEREEFRGQMPGPLANVFADALDIATGYVRNHDIEAARGWDALELLRGMIRQIRLCCENWKKRMHA